MPIQVPSRDDASSPSRTKKVVEPVSSAEISLFWGLAGRPGGNPSFFSFPHGAPSTSWHHFLQTSKGCAFCGKFEGIGGVQHESPSTGTPLYHRSPRRGVLRRYLRHNVRLSIVYSTCSILPLKYMQTSPDTDFRSPTRRSRHLVDYSD